MQREVVFFIIIIIINIIIIIIIIIIIMSAKKANRKNWALFLDAKTSFVGVCLFYVIQNKEKVFVVFCHENVRYRIK